jgi:Transposase IS66 family
VSRCGRRLKAVLPAEYRYGYGPRLTALIGELSGSQRDSRSAVQEFCSLVLGAPISRGAVQRVVDRVSEAIKPCYEAPELAKFGRRVMVELQRLVQWVTAPPTSGEVQTWYARMVHLIDQDRRRQDEAGTFARTLDREMRALWTFVVEEGVEPTNNRAERALRFAVLWRKISQGSYNAKGDRWVERILSLRETCRGIHTFPVLVEAVTCSFNGQPPDVSWMYRI